MDINDGTGQKSVQQMPFWCWWNWDWCFLLQEWIFTLVPVPDQDPTRSRNQTSFLPWTNLLLLKLNPKFVKKRPRCGLSKSSVCWNRRRRCPCRRLGHILWIFGSYPTRRRFNFIRIFAFSNCFKWSNRTGIFKPSQVHRLTVMLSCKSYWDTLNK